MVVIGGGRGHTETNIEGNKLLAAAGLSATLLKVGNLAIPVLRVANVDREPKIIPIIRQLMQATAVCRVLALLEGQHVDQFLDLDLIGIVWIEVALHQRRRLWSNDVSRSIKY